jgi:hypothetical protein
MRASPLRAETHTRSRIGKTGIVPPRLIGFAPFTMSGLIVVTWSMPLACGDAARGAGSTWSARGPYWWVDRHPTKSFPVLTIGDAVVALADRQIS